MCSLNNEFYSLWSYFFQFLSLSFFKLGVFHVQSVRVDADVTKCGSHQLLKVAFQEEDCFTLNP